MGKKTKLLTAIAVPLVGGAIVGAFATKSARNTYRQLKTPQYSPPGWVFPVAWTSLYTMMGIAKYKFDQQPKSEELQKNANQLYQAQLGLNFLWSFLFFRWNLRGTALVDASLLLTAVIANTNAYYKKSKLSGTLMLPYVGWATYAVYLNYSTWELNREK